MFKNISLLFLFGLSLHLIACAQNGDKSKVNQTSANVETVSKQSKTVEIPAGVKNKDYEKNPEESLLYLSLNSDGQIFSQDKPLDDAALKNLLAKYDEKHKNDPSTSDAEQPSVYDDKYKSFYLKADARAAFSQVLKVLKAVQESSAKSYRAKFIVNPQETAGKAVETPNGRYFVKVDLGKKTAENNEIPRPNPLTLLVNLAVDGKVKLNFEDLNRSEFPAFLQKIFKQREENGVFREGTNEVEKKMILIAAPDAKYGDVIKFIDELYEVGANPIVLGGVSDGAEKMGSGSGRGTPPSGGKSSDRGNGQGTGVGQGTGSGARSPRKP